SVLSLTLAFALTAGDIAIIGSFADNPDEIAVAALLDIPEGTVITLTDNAWDATTETWRSGEGSSEWTCPAGGITKGTVVSMPTGSMALSASGDQILAYEGSTPPTSNSSSLWLYGFSFEDWTWADNSNSSDIPTALASYNVAMSTTTVEVDNAYFANGTSAQTSVSVSGTQAELLALFTDSSLYYTDDTRPLNMPAYTITVQTGGGNTTPYISNIAHTPSTDILSTTTVSVSADVTDSDGTVALVQLKWGTQTGVYPNTINMSLGTGDTYTTDSNIPAQIDETTVYYVVFAMDDDSDTTTSGEQSYTVRDPVYTTLPYGETFDADLGDCYVYSVSGDSKQWIWSTYQCAYMNGYNSGDTEEDWLILPGINFNNYSDVTMSFDTWYNYGTDDVNNYLKLMYSTDYAGYGDPTPATWAELPFTHPTAAQTWTSSGIIDLSGISGTSVWIGYKYRYEAGNYRSWEVDNVSILEGAAIFASVSSLDGFTYVFGNGPSAEQMFTVSGTGLTDDIVLTAPTDYEISLSSGTGYASPITLTHTGGNVAETTIYVRLEAGLPAGTYNDELINITSTGATGLTVACSGEVTAPPPPDAPVATAATDVTSSSFTANWNASTGATGYYLDVYTIEPAIATDLFFSEYIEGASNNKALEIYNGTGADVDLSDYTVELYSNGSSTVGNTLELTGTLANGDVYVIANSSAVAEILNVADVTSTVTYFNGDDALAILKESTASHVDIFGCIGEDPGSEWVSGDHSTLNMTLVRKSSVTGGVTTNPATGFPTLETEWDAYPQDTFDYLDFHSAETITYVTGYENLSVGNVVTYPVAGLAAGTTYHYVVRAYNDYGTSGDSNEISVTTTGGVIPEIVITGEPVPLANIAGVPSEEITQYQVAGSNLSDPIQIIAPTHFEISTTGTDAWADSLQVAFDFNGPIYVRLNSWEIGTHGGDITHNSTGATQATIFVEGETLAPIVTWNIVESLTPFAQEQGTPSDAQTYSLSATDATSDIYLSVDSPFELSTTGSDPWVT
ncbi:MAG: lamin tail domain-containing protein, partial [Candidatus Syntrophosphaera sp.]